MVCERDGIKKRDRHALDGTTVEPAIRTPRAGLSGGKEVTLYQIHLEEQREAAKADLVWKGPGDGFRSMFLLLKRLFKYLTK